MEKQKKEIKIGMLLNYLSMAVEGLVIFFLNPFIIRGLGQADYGVYSLMTSFTGYLSIFEFGLGTTIIRYVAKYNAEEDEKGKQNFLSMCFAIYFFIALILVALIAVLYQFIDQIFENSLTLEQIDLAKKMFLIIAASMTITTLGSVFSAIISGYEKFIFSRVLILLTACLNVILTVIVLLTKTTAIRLTIITLVISIVTIISNILYVFLKLKVKVKFHIWDFALFKEIFSFSIFVFLQTLITQIYWRLDQLIIGSRMENAAVPLAVYAVAMKINDLVLAFTTVINRYQLPTITRLCVVEKNEEGLLGYIARTSKFVAILYVAIVIGFIFFGERFINIYAGEGYELAYPIVLIVVISAGLNRIHGCGADVLKAKKENGWYTVTVLGAAVLNIVLTIYLIDIFGIIGAAIGTAISLIIGNTIAYYWCMYKKASINILKLLKLTFKGFVPVILLSVIGCFILNKLLSDQIVVYLLKMGIFTIIYLISVYIFVLEESDRERIKSIMKRLIGRKENEIK